jgi:hypothetical protein
MVNMATPLCLGVVHFKFNKKAKINPRIYSMRFMLPKNLFPGWFLWFVLDIFAV